MEEERKQKIRELEDRIFILESENRRARFNGGILPTGFGPEVFHGVSRFNSISDPDIDDIPLEWYR